MDIKKQQNGVNKSQLETLPLSPGVYIMYNAEGEIIYVGKAKNLKNRVTSYFVGEHNEKTAALVSRIERFEYIVTKTELEALTLECGMIKHNNPKYNIKLKDDKGFSYIKITNEDFPSVSLARKTAGDDRNLPNRQEKARNSDETLKSIVKISCVTEEITVITRLDAQGCGEYT